ncbi:glycosyltransferase family 4 protein [Winogradskyella litorisediminis]|uniref:Glycosyltransferase family 4 protein n=1 Tax=Winogradskyella litorisediminis TaxID=1156618 RepID=A0ABW3N6I8_9FLAO
MNVLFLTLATIKNINERGIYTDLLREFVKNGYNVSVMTPVERRLNKPTSLNVEDSVKILNVKTFNIQKTSVLEKGIGTLAIEYQYLKALKTYFKNQKFDLVLYSTPPITFSKVIKYLKQRDNAYCYLLLKDIFPQNAVDLKLIKKGGLLHRIFQKKEKNLYNLSDTIGCMSPANKAYILKNNSYLASEKVEVNPNSIMPVSFNNTKLEIPNKKIREKYNIPLDKKVFIYGGNLGKPQGIDFLIKTLETVNNENAFFLIVGSGTEFSKISNWFLKNNPKNAKLLSYLEKLDYDRLIKSCDVGLIFLHKDFTIPNFPSRLLSYLEMGLPIIAATDVNTDIGYVVESNNCGFWVEAGDLDKMQDTILKFTDETVDLKAMKTAASKLLINEYHVSKSFKLINDKLQNV